MITRVAKAKPPAWKSLDKVSKIKFEPGDQVYLKGDRHSGKIWSDYFTHHLSAFPGWHDNEEMGECSIACATCFGYRK